MAAHPQFVADEAASAACKMREQLRQRSYDEPIAVVLARLNTEEGQENGAANCRSAICAMKGKP